MRAFGVQNAPVELPAERDEVGFVDPEGRERRVPAFWNGDGWRVRYASSLVGEHRFDGGTLELRPYEGANPLLRHGPLRVAADGRRFEHADGTPFLWVGDTWWLAFSRRLAWPGDFQRLTAQRVRQGYSLVQLVAGLYPEMHAFDPAGDAESGWPWTDGFGELRPEWWDEADLKLQWLVRSGLVPCVVGAWGYYLPWAGVETMQRHWRELVARWGAYPVVWCVAGEAKLPFYDDIFGPRAEALQAQQAEGWAEVARSIRATDPFGRPLTVHPSPGDGSYSSRDVFADEADFDFVMLQTGHADRQSYDATLETLQRELACTPRKPVLNAEVCYEGIMSASWQDTQRFLFWTHLLSGAAGHTYGAQGLWGMSHGNWTGLAGNWGGATWEEAAALPGGAQVGLGAGILRELPWERFEPHPEWVEPHWTEGDRVLPYAAGVPDLVALCYFPSGAVMRAEGGVSTALRELAIRGLGGGRWRARFLSPATGRELDARDVVPQNGEWRLGPALLNAGPTMEDWLLILQRA